MFNTSDTILILGTSKGLKIVNTGSILRIQAVSNYCKIFFADGKSLVVAKLLSWFEEKLTHFHFARLHRGHLVNMKHIQWYDNLTGTEVVLSNNERLTVSRRKRIEFRKVIGQYCIDGSIRLSALHTDTPGL